MNLRKISYIAISVLLVSLIGCTPKTFEDEENEVVVTQTPPSFPTKQIQVVIPYAPGGGTDSVARALTISANNYFQQPILPVNKLGDSGARGLEEGLYANNDGYTVTLITTELNSLSAFGLIDFDYTSIEPLILLNSEPGAIVVAKDFPFDSMEALIKYMLSTETVYTIGSAGKGSIWNLAAKGVEKETGVQFESMYYNGTSIAVLDVLGGKIDIVIAGISEIDEHLEKGELKVLTILSDQRVEVLPEIPTFKELGYDFSIYTWRGLAVPKGVDQDTKEVLLENFTKAALDQDFIDLLDQLSLNYDYRNQEDFLVFIKNDLEFYKKLRDSLGEVKE